MADEEKLPASLFRPWLFTVVITPVLPGGIGRRRAPPAGSGLSGDPRSYLNSEDASSGRPRPRLRRAVKKTGKSSWNWRKNGLPPQGREFQAITAEVQRLAAPGRGRKQRKKQPAQRENNRLNRKNP